MQRFLLASASGAKRSLTLSKERTHIGRKAGCDIRIDEPGIPPLWGFLIRSLGDVFAIADREDTPLVINGEKTTRRQLVDGDQISLGSCKLIFEMDQERSNSLADDLLLMADRFHSRPDPTVDPAAETALPMPEELRSTPIERGPRDFVPAPAVPPANDSLDPPSDHSGADPRIEPAKPLDAGWPPGAWGRFLGLAGAQKNTSVWLSSEVSALSCTGARAVVSRRSGSVFLTGAEGPPALINRRKSSAGPNPLEPGALVGLGASVFRFELEPALGSPSSSAQERS